MLEVNTNQQHRPWFLARVLTIVRVLCLPGPLEPLPAHIPGQWKGRREEAGPGLPGSGRMDVLGGQARRREGAPGAEVTPP